jgi:hypothetical protein
VYQHRLHFGEAFAMPTDLIRTNVFLSVAERAKLKKLAAKQGVSFASVIRRVLDAFLGIPVAPVAPVVFKNDPPAR